MNEPIKLGVSACLLGENVRYDGGHKWDRFLTDTLGQYVKYVPVCPEVECGLGVPREAMRLMGDPNAPRLVTLHTKRDHTDRMLEWADRWVRELEKEDLCGFIFKSRSPSSGMERVKVYGPSGGPVRKGVGLFAKRFMNHFPLIPVEDEGRLHDPVLRENFVERIFCYKRLRQLLEQNKSRGRIVDFHTKHKLLMLSHSPDLHRKMGKLVGNPEKTLIAGLYAQYQEMLMAALRLKATPKKHINVLYHMMGYFKKELSADEKQELLENISHYRNGHVPLIVPITLINHYVRKYGQAYLAPQYYLHPHPVELKLRNHV
jgi:uncharacterized protein YbgA (DUF1722 family)/uncharacterized protein YbbK (DUF523 family)